MHRHEKSFTDKSLRASALCLLFLGPAALLLQAPSCGPDTPSAPPSDPLPGAGDDGDPGDDDAGDPSDGDAAEIVSLSFPSTLNCGASATASLTMRNAGTTTWTRADGLRLGAYEDSDPFYHLDTRVDLPDGSEVPPGSEWTFSIPLVAPVTAGTYKTDWQMLREFVHWFGDVASSDVEVACGGPGDWAGGRRNGRVRLDGNALLDDDGHFLALGATMFWAAWGYKFDSARLEQNLQYLADNGFDYIRALGVVGDPAASDYWDGREIDDAWSDYDTVIAGLTDLAYDTYGLRVEWTLIGDGQVSVPSMGERYALVDRFLAMSSGREQKIMHFEIANESWQNGFSGSEGIDDLRELTSYMQDRTEILVAASAPPEDSCEEIDAIYGGGVGDIATIHFSREISLTDGHWRPVRQPWGYAYCPGPVASNNEPIGPGSSVNTENDPIHLLSAVLGTWIANIPFHVFHSRAGVRGDQNFWEMSGADLVGEAHALLPPQVPNWTRKNAHWSDSPFKVYAEDAGGTLYADQMWPDLSSPAAGAVRVYSQVSGNDYVGLAFGILEHVRIEARRHLSWEASDVMTGDLVDAGELQAGEQVVLSGYEALLLTGAYLD
jgi:hypothetical protein